MHEENKHAVEPSEFYEYILIGAHCTELILQTRDKINL